MGFAGSNFLFLFLICRQEFLELLFKSLDNSTGEVDPNGGSQTFMGHLSMEKLISFQETQIQGYDHFQET